MENRKAKKKPRSPGVDSKGYLVVKSGPHRDVRVHTLVAEAMLKRKLQKDEDVHHKNGDKLDCNWENLEIKGHQEHGAVSSRQRWFLKTHDVEAKKEWDRYFESGRDEGGVE